MNLLTFSLLITLVSIPTMHASQRESSCSSASLGTITSTSKYTQQRLQKIRTNIMNLTLSDLTLSHGPSKNEENKDEKQTSLRIGDLVAQLPCGHSFGHAYLERSMEGRAEGELPRCPNCRRTFEIDQVEYSRVTKEKE